MWTVSIIWLYCDFWSPSAQRTRTRRCLPPCAASKTVCTSSARQPRRHVAVLDSLCWYVWHDSCDMYHVILRVAWRICTRTGLYLWLDAFGSFKLFKSVTWRIHTCAAFQSKVSHGIFIRVPHSIQKCQMAYSYVCRIPFTSVTWRIHRVTSLGCVMSTTGIVCVLSRIGGTTTTAQTLTSSHKMTRNPCLIYVFPTITWLF